MHTPRVVSDPFALMTNPQSVLAAMEASERLRALRSRVCRPLDKVGFGRADASDDDGGSDGWGDAAADRGDAPGDEGAAA